MGRANCINIKGKNVYHMDFSNLRTEKEITELITTCKMYIRNQPRESLYTLTDITNMHFNSQIRELFTSFVKSNKIHVKAGAVVGISGLQSIVYNAIMKVTGRNLKSMKSLDDAKAWIAMQQ